MEVFRKLLPYAVTDRKSVFTFGNFDGVHIGHQALLKKIVLYAKEKNIYSSVLTFHNHPTQVVAPSKVPLALTTPEQKIERIGALGVDICIDIDFTPEIAALAAEDFLLAMQTMVPAALWVVGSDVAFGRGREGDKDFLLKQADKLGFTVEFIDKVEVDGVVASSSMIRALIASGLLEEARRLQN